MIQMTMRVAFREIKLEFRSGELRRFMYPSETDGSGAWTEWQPFTEDRHMRLMSRGLRREEADWVIGALDKTTWTRVYT